MKAVGIPYYDWIVLPIISAVNFSVVGELLQTRFLKMQIAQHQEVCLVSHVHWLDSHYGGHKQYSTTLVSICIHNLSNSAQSILRCS
jgi:hypothetical protein